MTLTDARTATRAVRPGPSAVAAGLVAGRVAGRPAARCACCAVLLVELVAAMRLTVVDEASGGPVELVVRHAHSASGGVACTVPTPVRCATPRCELIAGTEGPWCWLCDRP